MSDLLGNPEARFSHVAAHVVSQNRLNVQDIHRADIEFLLWIGIFLVLLCFIVNCRQFWDN